ncbi:hypothetical protein ACFL9T_13720 [Thermodesulfobacteriota bacterium]
MNSFSTEKKDIRKFGAIAFFFFGVICVIGFWRQKVIITYVFGTLSVLGIGFMLLPKNLKPVYVAWMKIAHIIGLVITTLTLTLAYYLVITPSALIKRIFGGRPIPLSPDKKCSTYWVDRTEPVQPKERFIKRF